MVAIFSSLAAAVAWIRLQSHGRFRNGANDEREIVLHWL